MQTRETTREAAGICYTLTYKKVKNINLRVRGDGSVAVSAPARCSATRVDALVRERSAWITQAQQRAQQKPAELPCAISREQAQALFEEISAQVFPLFAHVLQGCRPLIKVRDMKTRWGVCKMSARQITFSLRLAQMPRAAVEYVVVHEYAHFIQPNHSKAFWAVVEQYLPDYKARKQLLRS